MSYDVSQQRVHTPSTLAEALDFLADHENEGWSPIAGGTDVMVGLHRDQNAGQRWLNLSRIRSELSGISRHGESTRIGAMTTMTELQQCSILSDVCPLIREAASVVGALQIQNRATVGGNIVNSSPAGDTLPVWLALDAEVELQRAGETRRVPYVNFMTGYRSTILRSDEILTAIWLPPTTRTATHVYFRKLAPRAAQGISKLVFAGFAVCTAGLFRHVRLAFGSAGPMASRALNAEKCATGRSPSRDLGKEAAHVVDQDLFPIDDMRSTAEYRLRVARKLVREFLTGEIGRLN